MVGERLTDPEELLHRQIHPDWIQAGRPSSQAFRPTPKDAGLLSVSRGSLTTAAAAYKLHTEQRGLKSAGVWSIRVQDCDDAELEAFGDPLPEPVLDPAHAVIDFRALKDKDARVKSQQLKARMVQQFVRKSE